MTAVTRCCHCSSAARRAASASSIDWIIARARLLTDLFFARVAMPSRVSRSARRFGRHFGDALERRDPRFLVIRLERDVEQLARIGDARHGLERGLPVGRLARDAPQELDVVNAAQGGGPHRVERRHLRDGRELFRILSPLERERRSAVTIPRR